MNAIEVSRAFERMVSALAPRLKGGLENARIKKLLNEQHSKGCGFRHETAVFLASIPGLDLREIFPVTGNVNPSKPARLVQLVNGCAMGKTEFIDSVTLRGLVALREAPGFTLNYPALQAIAVGGVQHLPERMQGLDAPNIKGVSLARLAKLAPRTVGMGSMGSMVSRTFGSPATGYEGEGIALMLKACSTKGTIHRDVTLDPAAPFARAFFKVVDGATDSQLRAILAPKKKGESDE